MEGYAAVLARTYDTGRVYEESQREFDGPAPTYNGLIPMQNVAKGSITANGLNGFYSAIGTVLPTIKDSLDTVFGNMGDSKLLNSLEAIYSDADTGDVRNGVRDVREPLTADSTAIGHLENVAQRLAEILVKSTAITEGSSPSNGGGDPGGGDPGGGDPGGGDPGGGDPGGGDQSKSLETAARGRPSCCVRRSSAKCSNE